MLITFVGMPASGKSTVGKIFAEKLAYQFLDLDALICEREQKSIPEIFAQQGEDAFRKVERDALISTLNYRNTILSTGGGAPCFFDNMDLINQAGLSIFLKTPVDILLQRIREDTKNIRPLYDTKSDEELKVFLEELLLKRELFYKKAKLWLKLD
jgi:shikimate kinase